MKQVHNGLNIFLKSLKQHGLHFTLITFSLHSNIDAVDNSTPDQLIHESSRFPNECDILNIKYISLS